MSSVVKENEILTSIPETATARPVASSTAAGTSDASKRPQPVALEVSVTVNGARTVAGSDKREPFSESTKTVLIFGHGAVIRLTSSVAPGQLLFLTNEKTKKEVVCQVVKSKNYHHVSGYVELEFTEAVAGFWGMRFPAAGAPQTSPYSAIAAPLAQPVTAPVTPASAQKPATAPAIESQQSALSVSGLTEAKFAAPVLQQTSPAAEAPPSISSSQPAVPPSQNLRVKEFPASIGSGVSESSKVTKVVEISRTRALAPEERITTTKVSAAASKSLLDSDEVKMPTWLEPLARNAAASSAAAEASAKEQSRNHDDVLAEPDLSITEISDVPETANLAVAAPSFGTRLLVGESDSLAAGTEGSSKKFLILGIAAGLLLLIGTGAWYMRQTPGGPAAAVSASSQSIVADNGNAVQSAQQAQVSAPSQSTSSGTYTAAAAPAATGTTGSSSGAASSLPEPVNASLKTMTKEPATNAVSPTSAQRAKKPMLGEVNLSAPIVNIPASGQPALAEALDFEGSSQPGPNGGLASGLGVSNSRQPAAPPVPLPVGGDVKAARLISSAPPIYPAIARTQRLGGNVLIDALVDATGKITSMKIVSGPPLLQQAAMDSLRQWKYEPAQLDGKPVATHLTVTIQFKLQ